LCCRIDGQIKKTRKSNTLPGFVHQKLGLKVLLGSFNSFLSGLFALTAAALALVFAAALAVAILALTLVFTIAAFAIAILALALAGAFAMVVALAAGALAVTTAAALAQQLLGPGNDLVAIGSHHIHDAGNSSQSGHNLSNHGKSLHRIYLLIKYFIFTHYNQNPSKKQQGISVRKKVYKYPYIPRMLTSPDETVPMLPSSYCTTRPPSSSTSNAFP
jgi:hypothetical protein